MKTRDKIAGIVFLMVTFAALLTTILAPGARFLMRRISPGEVTVKQSNFDTMAAYPFQGDAQDDVSENHERVGTMGKIKAVWVRIYDKIFSFAQLYTTESFYFRTPCVIVTKLADRAMGLDMTASLSAGQRILNGDANLVISYGEDMLGFAVDERDVSATVDALIAFGDQMNSEGRNFLFFMTPGKYAGNAAYPDYSIEIYDEILSVLEAEVDIVDMEAEIEKSGLSKDSLFFRTDHHWLPSTGLWADKLLCQYLNQNYNYSIDTSIFASENYETTILKNHFLGSQGKKVTTVYSAAEDFPIITPKYTTELEVFISTGNRNLTGNIQDTLFDYSILEKNDLYTRNDYALYGYGDQALIRIHNKNIHDGSRILMIKTSFADCMYPYLAATVENIDVIDLRLFKGSLKTFIEDTDPDTIVVLYGLKGFSSTVTEGEIFDFR